MLAPFCTSAWLGVRSSGYALANIQTSAALSERVAYSYQYPGFRFAHRFASPWAEVSYAFGVPPENGPIPELFYAKQIRSVKVGPFRARTSVQYKSAAIIHRLLLVRAVFGEAVAHLERNPSTGSNAASDDRPEQPIGKFG